MKKLFWIGLAATAILTSCNNDETVEMAQTKAIGFSSTFVNKGTRSIVDPSFKTTTLEDFAVYGFTQNGQIFFGDKVYKGGTASTGWSYDKLQYWIEGNSYTFGAIAPYSVGSTASEVRLSGDGQKVEMTVAFTNDGVTDLLHASPAQVTGVTKTYATPVPMTFSHQLSKVKFSFENAVGDGYNIKVKDIKITDAKHTGTLTIGTVNSWSAQSDAFELPFGNVTADDATADEAAVIVHGATLESYNEKLMIPTESTVEYTVTFTVELFQEAVPLASYDHSVKISGIEFKLGYCYDFKAILTHENIVDPEHPLIPIEFTVEQVEDWNEENIDQDLNVPSTR